MHLLKWIVVAIAMLLGGWMSFDGTRSFVTGDFVTAKSGPYAGQLGPWSKIVRAVGIEPRSRLMKVAHVVLGLLWIISAALFFFDPARGRPALMIVSVLSLWYLPFGTLIGIVELGLLFFPSLRNLRS